MSRITNSPGLGSASKTTVKLTVAVSPSNKSPPCNELSVKPATSLSLFGTIKVCDPTEVNKAAEEGSMVKVKVLLIVPSIIKSSKEESVMVCVAFQLVLVNVKLTWVELTSSVGLNTRLMITSLEGWASKTNVKLAV